MGGQLPSSDGLALFDFSGQQLFGFNSSRHPFIVDCHCMCKYGKNGLLACTYPDYPLHEFTLRTHQLTTVYIPPEIKGAQALSSFREWIIFYSSKPYQIESAFFFWDRKTRIRQVPFAEVPLRGIGNGKFLSYDTTSFTIIDAVALLQQYDPTTWYLK